MLMGRCGVYTFPAVVVLLLLLLLVLRMEVWMLVFAGRCGFKDSCPFDKTPKHNKSV